MNKKSGIPNKGKLIRQPNKVTLARYDFTVRQQRVFVSIIDRLQKLMDQVEKNKGLTGQLDLFDEAKGKFIFALELSALSKDKTSYNKLKVEINEMASIPISFPTKDPISGIKAHKFTHLFSTYIPDDIHESRYHKSVTIEIDQDIAEFLVDTTKDGFTKFSKHVVENTSNKYTHRIYTLCCKWKDKPFFNQDIDELREILSLGPKYQQFKEFKKFVLEPVKKELKEGSSEIYFEYKLNRNANHKITSIQFQIKIKKTVEEEETYFINRRDEIINALAHDFDFNDNDFRRIKDCLKRETYPELFPKFWDILDKVKTSVEQDRHKENKTIANPKAYLITSFLDTTSKQSNLGIDTTFEV